MQLISGLDAQTNEHRQRSSMGVDTYKNLPYTKDADFHNYGVFGELTWYAADRDRVITGARLDRASAKDYRQSIGSGMSARPNPTADDTRADTLPSGFVRYEHDLDDSPTTLYAGVGHAQRFPDYWELFSANVGPSGSLNAFDAIKPEKPPSSTSACSTRPKPSKPGRRVMSGRCATTSCSITPRDDGHHLPGREHRCADHGR